MSSPRGESPAGALKGNAMADRFIQVTALDRFVESSWIVEWRPRHVAPASIASIRAVRVPVACERAYTDGSEIELVNGRILHVQENTEAILTQERTVR